MNGVHDMGGDQDMGPIQYEKDGRSSTHLGRGGSMRSIGRSALGASGRSMAGVTGSNSFPRPIISA
jgi:hypothetical protein